MAAVPMMTLSIPAEKSINDISDIPYAASDLERDLH